MRMSPTSPLASKNSPGRRRRASPHGHRVGRSPRGAVRAEAGHHGRGNADRREPCDDPQALRRRTARRLRHRGVWPGCAWQCAAADLYHVNHEALVVEVVDDNDQPTARGNVGHIVLTTMWNPLMPFVRYRIGDAAAWATRPCRCGSSLPALTQLSGRTLNWIIDAEGRRVAPQRMWVSLHLGVAYLDCIERYRVRQDRARGADRGRWPDRSLTSELETRWVAAYRRLLGDVPVELRRVDGFDTRSSEKFEVFSSQAEGSG